MVNQEKILALQLILEDIRGNWGWNLEERIDTALYLSTELAKEYPIYQEMVDTVRTYKINCANGDNDGRFFRDTFPYGYEDMDKEHRLKKTFADKSGEFKSTVSCLTYPEHRFLDRKGE